MAINISLSKKCHCFTKSAFEKNFTAKANSKNPKTIFTEVSHPPDFGNDCSQLGKSANKAKGRASPRPKPDIPNVNWVAPLSLVNTPAKSEPSIGPVHEKETMAN